MYLKESHQKNLLLLTEEQFKNWKKLKKLVHEIYDHVYLERDEHASPPEEKETGAMIVEKDGKYVEIHYDGLDGYAYITVDSGLPPKDLDEFFNGTVLKKWKYSDMYHNDDGKMVYVYTNGNQCDD